MDHDEIRMCFGVCECPQIEYIVKVTINTGGNKKRKQFSSVHRQLLGTLYFQLWESTPN